MLLTKTHLNTIKEEDELILNLGLFFFDGKAFLQETLSTILAKLHILYIQFQRLQGWHLVSSSVCLLYDAANLQKVDVKFIDFGRAYQQSHDFVDK